MEERVRERQWLTIKQVAEQLGLSTDSVYALVAQGRLESYRVGPNGGRHRIKPAAVERYLEGCKAAPTVLPARRTEPVIIDLPDRHFKECKPARR